AAMDPHAQDVGWFANRPVCACAQGRWYSARERVCCGRSGRLWRGGVGRLPCARRHVPWRLYLFRSYGWTLCRQGMRVGQPSRTSAPTGGRGHPLSRSAFTRLAMSVGRGLLKRTRLPVTGCTNASSPAWSAWRSSASSAAWVGGERLRTLALKPEPYVMSPRSGWPIWARCTRIWCVRPVSRVSCRRLATGLAVGPYVSSTVYRVTACRPIPWLATMILVRLTLLRVSDAVIDPRLRSGTPQTSAR